jgi:ligand-binding sensor domain-containing protein
MIRILSFAILLFSFQPGISQSIGGRPMHKTYTVNDGLASAELYDVVQDEEGFIWTATDRGVCRFDGQVFRTFTKADGLADNTILRLIRDRNGRIWMPGFNGSLSWYKDGKIHIYSANRHLQSQLSGQLIMTVIADRDDQLWIGTKGAGLFKGRVGDTLVMKIDTEGMPTKAHFIQQVDSGLVQYSITRAPFQELVIDGTSYRDLPPYNFLQARPIKLRNGEIVLNWDHSLVQAKPGSGFSARKDLDYHIFAIFEDADETLWLGLEDGGAMQLKREGAEFEIVQHLFHGQTVTGICRDISAGLWMTTKGHGMHYIPNSNCRTFWGGEDLQGTPSYRYCGDAWGNMWVAFDVRGMVRCSENRPPEKVKWGQESPAGRVHSITNLDSMGVLVTFSQHFPVVFGENGITRQYSELVERGKYFAGQNKTIWRLNGFSLSRLSWPDLNATATYPFSGVRVADLYQLSPDSLVLATLNGLQLYDCKTESLKPIGSQFPELREHAEIARVNETFLLATRGEGLVFYRCIPGRPEMDSVWSIGTKDGLCTDFSNHVFPESDSVVWLSSQCGLYKLRFSPGWKLEGMELFDYQDGLASNQILHTWIFGDRVWVGTSSGLSTFRKGDLAQSSNFPVKIYRMQVNQQDTFPSSGHVFPYSQNDVRFVYRAIAFRRNSNFGYEYRLNGLQSKWTFSSDTAAVFSGLPPGDYNFELRAVQKEGESASETVSVSFSIAKAWWQELWFQLLSAFVLICIMVGIVALRLRIVRRQEVLRNKVIKLQAQSLRVQMNPHFAFNALGTIQHYITEGAELEALEQLGRFSDLLRLVLRHSESDWVPLGEELKMLRLYLDLESLRFEGKFEQSIEVSEELDVNFDRVPPLILQPFVENAIWHGLLKKQGERRLTIQLEKEDAFVVCRIEDNGVGRKSGEAKSKTDHFSMGIRVTQQRLELIRDHQNRSGNIRIEDLYTEDGKPAGTRVHIKIPLK